MTTARRLDGYTLDDWESLEPVEGHRVELVDGRFVVNAAPSAKHQRVADRLCRLLDDAVAPEGMEALTATGVRVRVREGLAYISDVVVSTERVETTTVGVDTVALVAEVVSPSTKKTDRLEKPAAFASAGVPAYWRVELDEADGPTVYCYQLHDGVYSEVAVLNPGEAGQVAVTGAVSVTFDPKDLHQRRK
ncbi:Uma2 family endonuclease [Saccharothrix coeruleofusca]|uniref:Uma2 family endonuclease n=1 Tax=Saccharothrix coeruleofusca TaxID=33919 RepID=UPI001AE9467E|nr:Uma2 family endonuclease [Saccharothrix coeruleofusca]MBP2335211.1 Uma2 family endonuclease [Saccharothrix coeruleofusca]